MTQRKNLIVIFLLSLITIILSVNSYKLYKKMKKMRAQISELSKIEQVTQVSPELFNEIDGILKKGPDYDTLLMGNDFVSRMSYYGVWEAHLQNALKQLIKPGDKALVLGAHIGYHALLISKLVGSDGAVSIFEANPHTLKFLRANLAFNDIQNVTLFPKAAFAENTTLQFHAITSGNTGGSHIKRPGSEKDNDPSIITVEAVSVDSIDSIKSIDILQMDIEGAEAAAVFGAAKLIDNSPNLIVFQEWSPFWMKEDVAKYLEFWRSRGYKIAQITNSGLKELSDDELVNSEQIDIIIAKNLDEIIAKFKPL